MSRDSKERCSGSKTYQISQENVAAETRCFLRLTTLFFQSALEALKVCYSHDSPLYAQESPQLWFGSFSKALFPSTQKDSN